MFKPLNDQTYKHMEDYNYKIILNFIQIFQFHQLFPFLEMTDNCRPRRQISINTSPERTRYIGTDVLSNCTHRMYYLLTYQRTSLLLCVLPIYMTK